VSPQEIVERVLALSKGDGCIVITTERSEANLRWANNTLTTNGQMRSRALTVISIVNGTAGTASGVIQRSSVSDDELEPLVRAAEQAAHDAGPADDVAPLVEPGSSGAGASDWDSGPEETSVRVFGDFAPALGDAFGRAGSAEQLLFGFAEHSVDTVYLGSSTGLRLRHVKPTGKFELNGKSSDLSRSAWTGAATADFTDIDVPAYSSEIDRRLGWAQRKVDLPAGRYETLLPPAAVADLLIYMYFTCAARDTDQGQTVFSKPGGGNRIGERLANVPVTLRSDPGAAGLATTPFVTTSSSDSLFSVFDNGASTGPTDWIHEGVLNALPGTRAWAERSGGTATPLIDNLILDGPAGGRSLEEMVASTERGLLLTCLWYIRPVDPQTLLLTGLTRDGVYLVEGGEVTGAVNNFRFNESPVGLLGRLAEVGSTSITLPREWNDFFTRAAMPTLRIGDFNMSTVSQAS
jgi:predicted Zn-dependent protease